MIKRGAALLVLLLIAALPARADFGSLVRAIESRYHVHQTGIPLFGLVRLIVWVAHPEGVYDLQLATYEKTSFGNASELAELVRNNAGEPFRPMVQTWSNRTGECTYVYAHPMGGDRVAMLIFAHDKDDTTIVRVVVSMNKFAEAVNRPRGVVASLR